MFFRCEAYQTTEEYDVPGDQTKTTSTQTDTVTVPLKTCKKGPIKTQKVCKVIKNAVLGLENLDS